MRIMKLNVVDKEKKNPPLRIGVADSFFTRFCGLMGRRSLDPLDGLLLIPCNSVHMCFMRFAIDVVYLDKEYQVLKVVSHLHPWWGLSWCPGAWAALEMEAGKAGAYNLSRGHQLMQQSC